MSTFEERDPGPVETPRERAASEGMPPPERGAAAYEGTRSAQQPTAPPPATTSGAADTTPGAYAGLPGTDTDYPAGSADRTGEPTPSETSGSGHMGQAEPLLPAEARDKLSQRLDHAVNGFVDRPREAVQEADSLYEELAALLPEALAARRRALRTSWEQGNADTEQLRVALRHYRETAQRLLDF
ncbi:hypothetical protein [Streptomyces sp. NPDC017529]|uniref:hypothetical protein n=1 Tax=Streptomyces sp. NPDC017529 TaxID=3365000 RepID=UPI0037A0E2A6